MIRIKPIRAVIALALVLPVVASAQSVNTAGDPCFAAGLPFNGQALTVSTSAIGFTRAQYRMLEAGTGFFNATAALVCSLTNDVTYRADGVAPTATAGSSLPAKSCVCIGAASLPSLQLIRAGSSDSAVFGAFIAPPL